MQHKPEDLPIYKFIAELSGEKPDMCLLLFAHSCYFISVSTALFNTTWLCG